VRAILGELGLGAAAEARMIEVWNKIDALGPEEAETLAQIAARTPRACAISAATGQGVAELLALVAAELADPVQDETITLGFGEGRKRAWLFDQKLVRAETPTDDGYRVDVRWSERDRTRYDAI